MNVCMFLLVCLYILNGRLYVLKLLANYISERFIIWCTNCFCKLNHFFNLFKTGPYKRGSGGQTITFENSAVVVVGHMEPSTYHPMLNISVIPQVRQNQ